LALSAELPGVVMAPTAYHGIRVNGLRPTTVAFNPDTGAVVLNDSPFARPPIYPTTLNADCPKAIAAALIVKLMEYAGSDILRLEAIRLSPWRPHVLSALNAELAGLGDNEHPMKSGGRVVIRFLRDAP
jgi:hypothetical protein